MKNTYIWKFIYKSSIKIKKTRDITGATLLEKYKLKMNSKIENINNPKTLKLSSFSTKNIRTISSHKPDQL